MEEIRSISITSKVEEVLFWFDQKGHFVALEIPSGNRPSNYRSAAGIEKGQYMAFKSIFDRVLRKQDLERLAKEKVKEIQIIPLDDQIYYYRTIFVDAIFTKNL